MFRSIREIIRLLSPQQRQELLLLQLLVVLMSLFEVVGIASVGPFMALAGNRELVEGDGMLGNLYRASGFSSPMDFVFWAGIACILTLTVSALVSILTLWRLSLFGQKVGVELGDRLYEFYLHRPWLFHAGGNSATLIKKIAADAHLLTSHVIHPLLVMNAKVVLAAFILVSVVLFNPAVAIGGGSLFFIAYLLLYRLVKGRLRRNGQLVTSATAERYSLLLEGFGGVKDILLLHRQRLFVQRFRATGSKLFRAEGTTQAIAQVPRYIIEVLAFGGVILLVLYLIRSSEGNLGTILPALAFYSVAGLKLLPAFQGIYQALASIRAGMPAFESIQQDLADSRTTPEMVSGEVSMCESLPEVRLGVSLRHIGFTYPGKTIPAIRDLSLEIPARSVVGIVGATGSGKSTLVDILLGLVQPDQGEVVVDGVPVTVSNLAAWQQHLAYVPQSIFLTSASILENIAFGLPNEKIDMARVQQAVTAAHLDELVRQLPQGLATEVGERGVQLSGGQRQRIGIARALYNDADLLVMDEATSALDNITEKIVMEAIGDFSGKKTIIMIAHRFSTIEKCDRIFLMEQGELVDQGSYAELFERSQKFRRMAQGELQERV